ncbi:alpha/beta hydrolase [Brevibacillus ruminantium]|uniref:Alpha/beta hydrolase n=1 Tax=Brevibacillus ruminantium TaxID=2950604 RepID=A0ABY4WND2_9BACL|nr:alpha/beta hydrolase [Brevibacillus ruminantium]USG67592.1 alpha/beta hydrolase [Brevibacillus ruminantium]
MLNRNHVTTHHLETFPDTEGGKRFQQAYEASLGLWPVAYERFYVPTRFGQTHVVACGPADAEPLVLLHGALFSSSMWYPNVGEWSKQYRVYAIDVLEDQNLSIPTVGCRNRTDFKEWMIEILQHLHIQKAKLVGLSLGGMHVINLLVQAQEWIERVVVISPAESFVPFHPDFYTYAYGLFQPGGVERFVDWMFADRYTIPAPFLQQYRAAINWLGEKESRPPGENGFPYVYSDEELSSIHVPVLLLLGEKEVIYDPRAAQERAKRLVPGIETMMVHGAGHVLSMERPSFVNKAVTAFMRDDGRAEKREG